jgi:hypothetical protein
MFTKKTRIEWATVEDQLGNDAFNTQRVIKIDEMIAADKTDGLPVPITDLITERYWIDEVSAQEYIDFILSKVQMYNLNLVSTQILDAT